MRSRRAPLLTALLLIGALLGGVTGASASPRAVYGFIGGVVTDAGAACTPFDSSHFLMIDAWDSSLTRYKTTVSDGTGVYSIGSLLPGDYKVRFRTFDVAGDLVTYWWYGGATNYDGGATVSVASGEITTISPCVPTFDGGTFKGSVASAAPGFDPACATIQAYEAGTRIGVGLVNPVRAAGGYRHWTDIPAGQYTALVHMSTAPACIPSLTLDQWWKGHSGPDFGYMSNAPLASSGTVFTIGTGGALTKAIHFDLVPIGTCNGKVPTILGTTADDVITGTAGPDVIMLYHGDDQANGGDGKDAICGGKGTDNLFGDAGNDRIWGDRHPDYLHGDAGRDLLFGGTGGDQVFGGDDDDKVRGGGGNDLVHGNAGADYLWGNRGDDVMFGHEGNDTLYGGPGDDSGNGGIGVDTCDIYVETQVDC